MDQVESVRDFNRYYTRRLGVLTDRYLGQARPLSEARLLFEIGDRGDVRDLRVRLGLDSGYLSRLLRSLERQGLVRTRAHPDDGRVRIAELTEAGRRERAELDTRSRAGIGELLERLSAGQRRELIDAQRRIRRLLRLAAVTVRPVDAGAADARRCLRAYAGELRERFPEGYDDTALVDPAELTGDAGVLLVAYEEDRPVGCGAWRRLAADVAEIRHLWVAGPARGLGLGRRLLEELEAHASGHAVTTLRLGTHTALTEAIALYRSSGYRPIPPYDSSPYHQLSFAKRLAGPDVSWAG
ncbi:helix-turn-helix domain-containing GNAT family N-acetyltransferase [Amorphoplanes nipponensis]|uniref:Transcriptional regulator, MarR family protein n=1 Tax=Actinoplanes nipponensis TaxID=135950 RepID=A0A919JH70_9ACTN|nr:MarR family winged helix-turn-helix transcriptional regulator [Actinoplanes nipponensis]GIE49141.1 putative transcriptional regulator, MarR family protein [Actinoplanes nipponensis]